MFLKLQKQLLSGPGLIGEIFCMQHSLQCLISAAELAAVRSGMFGEGKQMHQLAFIIIAKVLLYLGWKNHD